MSLFNESGEIESPDVAAVLIIAGVILFFIILALLAGLAVSPPMASPVVSPTVQ